MEARLRVQRLERRIQDLESASELRDDLTAVISFLETPLVDFLNHLPREALARLCRSIFKHFGIEASGVAQRRTAEIAAYELNLIVKQAIVEVGGRGILAWHYSRIVWVVRRSCQICGHADLVDNPHYQRYYFPIDPPGESL